MYRLAHAIGARRPTCVQVPPPGYVLVRIGKDPPDWVVTIRGSILAYMYLYCAPHPNQSIIHPAILAYMVSRVRVSPVILLLPLP